MATRPAGRGRLGGLPAVGPFGDVLAGPGAADVEPDRTRVPGLDQLAGDGLAVAERHHVGRRLVVAAGAGQRPDSEPGRVDGRTAVGIGFGSRPRVGLRSRLRADTLVPALIVASTSAGSSPHARRPAIAIEPLGDRGFLARFATEDDAARWAEAVRRAAWPGVVDVVLAYRTVGVHRRPGPDRPRRPRRRGCERLDAGRRESAARGG